MVIDAGVGCVLMVALWIFVLIGILSMGFGMRE
jgi:hypothetical protein